MDSLFESIKHTINHLETLHETFTDAANFNADTREDHLIYLDNKVKLEAALDELGFYKQLYGQKGRQMILSDFYEYVFFGRGFYSMKDLESKASFIRALLRFTNLLSCYETLTVADDLRYHFFSRLESKIACIVEESQFEDLKNFHGKIGLPKIDNDAPDALNKYFDSMLPKTAGGLWHELLVYVFMLRNDVGYIVPLLLHQRLMGLNDHLVPPDFLIITYDKHVYGIEVGVKKEIQSGGFSLKTSIPTATIDTINSRVSDRCPICKRWIPFCDHIINRYSDLTVPPPQKKEFRCITGDCTCYTVKEIAEGKCISAKYSRQKTTTLLHTHHDYSNGLHYHYKCVLNSVGDDMKNLIIETGDTTAIKAHYPYYAGLENLMKGR